MKIFNLAEELEKERKKNKELEDKIKEFKLTIRTQFQQIQELIDRENRAIEYIEKKYYKKVYKTKGTSINDLLNILKGGKDD